MMQQLRIQITERKWTKYEVSDEYTKTLGLYRQVQVVEKNFNVFSKGQIVPTLVACTPGLQIFTQYVCIKLHSEIPMPGFLVFPMVFVEAIFNNILVFSLASIVNTRSLNLLQRWRKELVGFNRKERVPKILQSYKMMTIQFGSNFIDKGTPLVIQDFCLSQTLSLLLMSNYK